MIVEYHFVNFFKLDIDIDISKNRHKFIANLLQNEFELFL